MGVNDKKKIVSDLAYAINRIPLSLYHGNTNQIGRDAWNGLVEYIVNAVCRYVNMLNSDFKGAGTKINSLDHPRFLHPDLPPFVNTRVYNNNFHISIGLVSSSLDTHDVTDAHMTALGNAALDDEGGCRADSYAPGQDLGASAGATFEAAAVNIGLGQVQAALGLPQGPAQPPPPPPTQPVSHTVSQEEMKARQAKELPKNIILRDGKALLGYMSENTHRSMYHAEFWKNSRYHCHNSPRQLHRKSHVPYFHW